MSTSFLCCMLHTGPEWPSSVLGGKGGGKRDEGKRNKVNTKDNNYRLEYSMKRWQKRMKEINWAIQYPLPPPPP